MKMVALVTVTRGGMILRFYAGADTMADAYYLAAQAGYQADEVDVKLIPNKHGTQLGEFKAAR